MGWFDKAKGLAVMVEKEKVDRSNLKVRGVCIHGETDCVRCAAEDYEVESSAAEQKWEALDDEDLRRVIFALPDQVREALRRFPGEAVIAGGFIRATIAGENIHDIDLFVTSEKKAKEVLDEVNIKFEKKELHDLSIIDGVELQTIWRYAFKVPIDVPNDFDYTVCKAVVWFDKADKNNPSGYRGACHERFYRDLARRELVYCNEREHEQITGFPRLLKYTSYGYTINAESLSEVIVKICCSLDFEKGFEGMKQQLKDAYKANGSDVEWGSLNKEYVKPKPKPKPKPESTYNSYSYGS